MLDHGPCQLFRIGNLKLLWLVSSKLLGADGALVIGPWRFLRAVPGLQVDLSKIQSNLVYFDLDPMHPWMTDPPAARVRLTAALRERGVLIAGGAYRLRAVTHYGIERADVEATVRAVKKVMKEAQ